MNEKYYVDANGKFLGVFIGAEPPEGAIEVPTLPSHGDSHYVNGEWVLNPRGLILRSIAALEGSITQRRLREAMLTEDGKLWLQGIEDEIEDLRDHLAALPSEDE